MDQFKPDLNSFLNQNVNTDELAAAGDEILQIAKDLAASDANARLDEYRFKEVFLPLFDGTPADQRKYPVEPGNWATVAGNVYREVDVIDEQGNVLFTVPPLVDRTAINPIDPRAGFGGVMDMVVTMQQLQRNSPKQAKAYLDAKFAERAGAMFKPDNIIKYLRTWNAIFTRYGRPPILELPDEPGTTTQAAAGAATAAAADEDWDLL